MDLTQDEIKYICTVMPYQETVDYFRRYTTEFNKLRPGFRIKTLDKDMVTRTLYEFRKRDFIASYLIKHIDRWMKEICEELDRAKEIGLDQEAAYVSVLSQSFFAGNVALFFRIKEEEKSEDYLRVLDAAVLYEEGRRKNVNAELDSVKTQLKEVTVQQKELVQQVVDKEEKVKTLRLREKDLIKKLEESTKVITVEQKKCVQVIETSKKLEEELKKVREDEVWKTSEMQQKIDVLGIRFSEQEKLIEDYKVTIEELRAQLSLAEKEIETWKNMFRNKEKQLFTYKAEKATLLTDKDADKKQIQELQEALEQAVAMEKMYKEQLESIQGELESRSVSKAFWEEINEQKTIKTAVESISKRFSEGRYHILMRPEDMDEFEEYFCYNLGNIGFDQNQEGALDFLRYIEKMFFYGVPLMLKRGPGINLANALSNTLYGVPVAARLLYSDDINVQKINDFLINTPDRVVCIDGFIGNCNILELMPMLDNHRNKIIILTYMFDRTLSFVPKEILSYVQFINVDIFESLLRIKTITEEPSEIKEVHFEYRGIENANERLKKIFRDVATECGMGISVASSMADMIDDENELNEMLMFTLLPYVQKVIGTNPYTCSKRLQRYAGEKGRCIRKDIMIRWFGE